MKVLLVKTSSLGDIVHVFPVVSYLKNRFINAQIEWVVEAPFAPLVAAHPDIAKVHTIDSKVWRRDLLSRATWHAMGSLRQDLSRQAYDVVFDLQGNIKSGIVTWLAASRQKVGFNYRHVAEWPNIFATNQRYTIPHGQNIRTDYLNLVQRYFDDPGIFDSSGILLKVDVNHKKKIDELLDTMKLTGQRKILVCGGSAWRNKQLPVETLLAVLQKIQARFGCSFLFGWGNDEEKVHAEKLCESVSSSLVMPRLPLPALQNLMGKVDLVISMDSLPLHLAATTSTPTFSFFGPSSAKKYKPLGLSHHAFQGSCPYGRFFEKRCPMLRTCPTGACMQNQDTEKLFYSFTTWVTDQLDWDQSVCP